MTKPKVHTLVMVTGEGGTDIYEMSHEDAVRCRKLLGEAVKHDEYPDEVNDILDRAAKVTMFGIIDTSADNWGWYKTTE